MTGLSIALITSATTAMAGKGYFVTVYNNSDAIVKTMATDTSCVYESENLTTTINPHSNSGPLYVEEKSSGGCFFADSKLKLHIEKLNNGLLINSADIPFDAGKLSDSRVLVNPWGKSSNMDVAYVAGYVSGKQDSVKINVNY